MRIGSLFSGYGGLEHGVQAAIGGDVAWHCDNDPGACKILAHRYPDVPNLGDITTVDWSQVEPVDAMTAGFPCQPVSAAGKQAGLDDERWLFGEIVRALGELDPQPRLLVLENVPRLRTIDGGNVMAHVVHGLASVGYVGRYLLLRASDVGPPHKRERIFFTANPRSEHSLERWEPAPRQVAGGRTLGEPAGRGGVGALLPTPRATDGTKGGPNQRGSSGDLMLPSAVTLLPTHAVNDMGSLAIEVQRLSTPSSIVDLGHAHATEDRPREDLRDVRSPAGSQEIRQWATRGPNGLPQEAELLSGVREHQGESDPLGPPVPNEATPQVGVRGVREVGATARSPHRPRLDERRPSEPADAVRVVSPNVALAGGPSRPHGCCEASIRDGACPWGIYSAAVHRWEILLGRVAPSATQLSTKGTPQLSPKFSEFLMGLPAGWVTGVPGLTRNEALKAIGNGCVPQQAEWALRLLLGSHDENLPAVPPVVCEAAS